jgi:Xaa-Pro aminopeptidase
MADKDSKSGEGPLNVDIGAELRPYLTAIARTKVYGTTPTEVVRTFVGDGIKLLIQQGLLKWRVPTE